MVLSREHVTSPVSVLLIPLTSCAPLEFGPICERSRVEWHKEHRQEKRQGRHDNNLLVTKQLRT